MLIVISVIFSIALSVLVIIGSKEFYDGHHIWDIPLSSAPGHRLNVWVCQWCYIISNCTVKISVLLFYRRLSVKFSGAFMVATWAGIAYITIYGVVFCFLLLLECRPLQAYWMAFNLEWRATNEFTCLSESALLPLSGAFSVVGDFYSTLLPIILVTHLQLPVRQKLGLYALFAFGFIVVGAGIVRTVITNNVINVDYDYTWILWEMWIWTLVEVFAAIVAASAPALKPLVNRYAVKPVSRSLGAMGSSARRAAPGSQHSQYQLHDKSSTQHSITKQIDTEVIDVEASPGWSTR